MSVNFVGLEPLFSLLTFLSAVNDNASSLLQMKRAGCTLQLAMYQESESLFLLNTATAAKKTRNDLLHFLDNFA